MKRTPLFDAHVKLGARMVEFGGWEMPVFYSSILEEHRAVRAAAGLFDISHMGEVRVRGAAAGAFLNSVLTNDIRRLTPGLGQYTLMGNERGGVVDDLYAWQLAADEFLLVINASRIDADVQWLRERWQQFPRHDEVMLSNESDRFAAVAAQGPKTAGFIDASFGDGAKKPSQLRKNEITATTFAGQPALVSRSGYTGEDGFEILVPPSSAEPLWNALLETGRADGLTAAGLGARDTLRTEACYPLYGHELDENTTPIEAGLGFFTALDKGDFTGRSVLAEQKAGGAPKKLVAFKMTGRSAPPRQGYRICSADPAHEALGVVTSGTQSPTLLAGIGLGYVPPAHAAVGLPIAIEIRGNYAPAVIVPKPFYRRP